MRERESAVESPFEKTKDEARARERGYWEFCVYRSMATKSTTDTAMVAVDDFWDITYTT